MQYLAIEPFTVTRKLVAGVFIILLTCFSLSGCQTVSPTGLSGSGSDKIIPQKMLWAWERPEDLRFLESKDHGVAFLAQTLAITGDDIAVSPRRQPLEVNPETFLMAVTRIETDRASTPKYSTGQIQKITRAVMRTLYLKNVKALQIDFDAATSERNFYRALLKDLRAQIPAEIPFSITALASWCTADSWLTGAPVDEVVPMAFRMGADAASIRGFLGSGKDWQEPLCQKSYGFSIDEPFEKKLVNGRRIYFFNDRAWKKSDLSMTDNF
jgi:predicted small secreted protein